MPSLLAWLSALILCSWALWESGCSYAVSNAQPRDLFRLSVSTTPFVSEGNTSSGAFSRGLCTLSGWVRRGQVSGFTLLISDSSFRLVPEASSFPGARLHLLNPALPQFVGLSCIGLSCTGSPPGLSRRVTEAFSTPLDVFTVHIQGPSSHPSCYERALLC